MQLHTRLATISDTNELVRLNKIWQKPNLMNTDNGFLSVEYDKPFFESVIENEDLVSIIGCEKIIGYILVNTIHLTDRINQVKSEYFEHKPENVQTKIAFGYQICIDKLFHGRGYFTKVQTELIDYYNKKYEILVSTVSKENGRSIGVHKKTGWAFYDTLNNYYIIEKYLY